MKNPKWFFSLAVVVCVSIAGTAKASFVYLDANRDNVVKAADDSSDWWTTSSYTADDRWRERTGVWGLTDSATTLPPRNSVVPGGDIYQSIDAGQTGKNAAAIKITISNVSAGDHLYVVFWSDQAGSPWTIKAGLDLGSLMTFSPYTGNRYQWALDSAGRKMWLGDLGAAPSAGSYTVYVDDLPTDDSNQRTWFDGVAAGSIPEPGTAVILLAGMGILGLVRRLA